MPAKKKRSRRVSGSNMEAVDRHIIQPEEYEDLPELTDEMIARGRLVKGGRPFSENPRVQVTIRLPFDVLAKWRATGPGWQTRMAERLSKI